MKRFLLICSVTCMKGTSKTAVTVPFSYPIKVEGSYPNKLRYIEATRVLLNSGDLAKYLPSAVFGNWTLEKEHYVSKSVNIVDIREITEEEFNFHFG